MRWWRRRCRHDWEALAIDLGFFGMGLETFTLWRCRRCYTGEWRLGKRYDECPWSRATPVGTIPDEDAERIRKGERL